MANNFFEIENVSFAAGGKNKVNNVSLKIENEGEIVCLLGPCLLYTSDAADE